MVGNWLYADSIRRGALTDEFSTGINTGNYDGAVYAIMAFSQKFGLALKYVDFNEFDQMMLSDDVLKILLQRRSLLCRYQ